MRYHKSANNVIDGATIRVLRLGSRAPRLRNPATSMAVRLPLRCPRRCIRLRECAPWTYARCVCVSFSSRLADPALGPRIAGFADTMPQGLEDEVTEASRGPTSKAARREARTHNIAPGVIRQRRLPGLCDALQSVIPMVCET